METNRSWSIDDKRLNFQFGTQIAWEIKGGKLGRMLRDATYTGITPQFWGSLDAVAGPRLVAPVRLDELRQGPAWPERARLARRRAGALPERAGRGPLVNALDVANAALEAVDGEAEAVAHVEHSGLARFAGSEVHQPTLIENAMVTLRVVHGHSSRRRDDEQDRRGRARRGRAHAPAPLPERAARRRLSGLGAARGPADGRRASTRTPRARARRPGPTGGRRDRSRRRRSGLRLLHERDRPELAVASSTGLSVEQRMTDATALVVAADENGSGYAEQTAWRAGGIDPARRRAGGRRKHDEPGAAARSSPACYRAVLEPYAFADLLDYFSHDSFGALGLLEERSYFAGVSARRSSTRRSRSPTTRSIRGTAEGIRLRRDAEAACAACRARRRPRSRLGPRDGSASRANGASSTGHAPPAELRDWGPALRALRVARATPNRWRSSRRARRRRSLHHASALSRRRSPARGCHHRHDARRDLPHPRRQDRRNRSSICASRSPSPISFATCSGSRARPRS